MTLFRLSLIILFTLFVAEIYSQSDKSGEIGLLAGVTYYTGELNKTPFTQLSPAGAVLYRHTFNKRYALRGCGNIGLIRGSGNTPHGVSQSFNELFVDISSSGEFHFLKYLPGNKNYFYSPYIHAGIGFSYLPGGNENLIFNIPFGLGFKHNIKYSPWILGFDYTLRKTFTDNIDYTYSLPDPKQEAYAGTNDWIAFLGINISYKINYKMKCQPID